VISAAIVIDIVDEAWKFVCFSISKRTTATMCSATKKKSVGRTSASASSLSLARRGSWPILS